ncbi:unnamed protein product [Closterium sp. NIES-53]
MVIEDWLEPERVVVASVGSGRSPAVSRSVTASKKPPLPFAPKPPSSVLEALKPPEPAPPAAEPHPPAAAPPHVHEHAGPALVALVAPVAPVESPVPVVVVDGPPGALVLDAPHVSVPLPAPVVAVGSSPHAVSATTGGPREVGGGGVASVPVLPIAATSVLSPDVLAVPDPAPHAAAPLAQHQPTPGRRQHWPHSPAPHDKREMTRRRHDYPRRRGSQANWAASRGGRGGWWGGRGRGGGWAYDQLVVGVDTVLARAATEKVVREAGVWDSGMVRADAVCRRGERKGQPEVHGIGEVNGPYPPVRRNGDGCQPVPGPVTGQRKHPLRVSAQGVQLHMPCLLKQHGVSAPVHL